MVATGSTVDLRRATKLAVPNDERLVQLTGLREVLKQCRDWPIDARHQTQLQLLKVESVRVPGRIDSLLFPMPVHSHQLHARLRKPLRQQNTLPERVVAVAESFVLRHLAKVKRVSHLRGEDHVEGLLIKRAKCAGLLRPIGEATHVVDLIQQVPPRGHAVKVDGFRQFQRIDRKFFAVGMLGDAERIELTTD